MGSELCVWGRVVYPARCQRKVLWVRGRELSTGYRRCRQCVDKLGGVDRGAVYPAKLPYTRAGRRCVSRRGVWVEQEEMRWHGGCLGNMYACVAHGGYEESG